VAHLARLADSPLHRLVLTGYQAPGTPGRQLLEGVRRISTPLGMLTVRMRVDRITLKLHPNYAENLRLIGTRRPRLFIAHCEEETARELEQVLRERGMAATAPSVPSRVSLE